MERGKKKPLLKGQGQAGVGGREGIKGKSSFKKWKKR